MADQTVGVISGGNGDMAITVARGTVSRMREHDDAMVLRVDGAADADAAARGLDAAGAPICDLGASYVSDVIVTPKGPVIFIDASGMDPHVILQTVTRHLEQAGIDDATLRFPDRTMGLGVLDHIPRCVVLRLYVAPPRRLSAPGILPKEWLPTALPGEWLDAAAAWVTEGHDPADELWVRRVLVEVTIAAGAVRQLFDQGETLVVSAKPPPGQPLTVDQARRAGWNYAQLLAELAARLGGRLRGANVVPGSGISLAAGGPDVGDAELLELFDRLKDLGRGLAGDAVWGHVQIVDRWAALGHDAWTPLGASEYVLDELLYGAHPYQILGPLHLRHFDRPPAGSQPLDGGRVEVSIGDPVSWLLDSAGAEHVPGEPYARSERTRDPDIADKARRVLAPALATDERIQAAYNARYESPGRPNTSSQ